MPEPVVSAATQPHLPGLTIHTDVQACGQCGGFHFRHRRIGALELIDSSAPLFPHQQVFGRGDAYFLLTCVQCAERAGAALASPRPMIVKRADVPDPGKPMREYATAQLLIWAQKLAQSHLERRGRIKADKTTVPICDTCGQECPGPLTGHGDGCAVGHVLHWIDEFVQASPAAPAPTASAAAGDFSPLSHAHNQADGYVGVVAGTGQPVQCDPECIAPLCACDQTTRCGGGCTFPDCECGEENRCPASYPGKAAEAGGRPSYWRGLDGGAR